MMRFLAELFVVGFTIQPDKVLDCLKEIVSNYWDNKVGGFKNTLNIFIFPFSSKKYIIDPSERKSCIIVECFDCTDVFRKIWVRNSSMQRSQTWIAVWVVWKSRECLWFRLSHASWKMLENVSNILKIHWNVSGTSQESS